MARGNALRRSRGYAAAALVLKPPIRLLPLSMRRAPKWCWRRALRPAGEVRSEVDHARGLGRVRPVLALVE
eukprot:5560316-Alexandrium_andersonii.AAC.1